MGEERTTLLMKYLAVIALVAMFAWFVTQSDPSGPQLSGWSQLQVTITNPLGSLNHDFSMTLKSCDWVDLPCHVGNIAGVFIGLGSGFVAIVGWVITTLISVGGGLFGVMTLTFVPALPMAVQVILWVFVAPFWILFIMTVFGVLRGN